MTSLSPASPVRPEDERPSTGVLHGYRWVVSVWVVVAAFALVTAYWSYHVDVPLRDPNGRMFRGRLTSALILAAVLAVVDAVVRARRTGWSPVNVLRTLRDRWPWQRIALVASGLLAYHCVYVCYRNLKSWNAFRTLRDDELLAFDRWLFLDHSPAELLHDLLGQGDAAVVLAFVYKSFTYLVPLSLVAALVFTTRIRDGYVFLMSAMWMWILGTAAYYLLPSLGPFAAASAEFAGLPHTAITDTQAKYLEQRAHLLAHPGAGDAFASIGAFASLHVGFTFMVVLMLRWYGKKRLANLVAVFLAGTILATVYFGWHYVSDDIAGILLAFLAVWLGRLMIYPRGRDHSAS
jgi:hypothetical protein